MTSFADATISTRLKRSNDLPRFAQHERQSQPKYSKQIVIKHDEGEATLHYRVSRREWIEFTEDSIYRRELFGWLRIKGTDVAAINMYEFNPVPGLHPDEFVDMMDAAGQYELELSEALVSHYQLRMPDFRRLRSIVDFRDAWSDPSKCPKGLWAKAAQALLRKHFKQRSILTMKAFPLEYEHCGFNTDGHLAFRKRQLAMLRYYGHLFRVRPFDHGAGDDGWIIHERGT